MKNYWFRICFEKEFEDESDAKDFLEERLEDMWENGMTDLSTEFEERKKVPKINMNVRKR